MTVTTVVPASVAALVLTDRLTKGKSSLISVMLRVIVLPNTNPDEGLVRVKVAVSVGSIRVSLTTVKLTVPVFEPLGMIMVLLLRV